MSKGKRDGDVGAKRNVRRRIVGETPPLAIVLSCAGTGCHGELPSRSQAADDVRGDYLKYYNVLGLGRTRIITEVCIYTHVYTYIYTGTHVYI